MSVEIVTPGKQGAPAHGLPGVPAPQGVAADLQGRVLADRKMAARIALTGAETYAGTYAAKWGESSPLAALSSAHTYGGSAAPRDNLQKIEMSAYEFDHHDVKRGAALLRDTIYWLALCTVPWTALGQPPLLRLQFGFVDSYGYLTQFDPNVTEFMLDDPKGETTGLPYAASFSLAFLREPQGPGALELRRNLPSSQGAPGGAGGLGSAKVNPVVVPGGR